MRTFKRQTLGQKMRIAIVGCGASAAALAMLAKPGVGSAPSDAGSVAFEGRCGGGGGIPLPSAF